MSHWDMAQSALLPMPTFASSDGRLIFANEAAGQLGMHWPRDQGRPLADFLCSIDGRRRLVDGGSADSVSGLARVVADDPDRACFVEFHSVEIELDSATGLLTFCWDVSERVRRERELRYQADHDTLTGLLRRHALVSLASEALSTASSKNLIALLLADMNDFKAVNDEHGHLVGDEVLAEIARRLRSAVRGHDAVARFGGDEFLVLARGLRSIGDVKTLVDRIHRSLDTPVEVSTGAAISVSVTVGAAVQSSPAGDDSEATDRLLEIADGNVMRRKRRIADNRLERDVQP